MLKKTIFRLVLLALIINTISCTPEEIDDNFMAEPTVQPLDNTSDESTEGEEGRRKREPSDD